MIPIIKNQDLKNDKRYKSLFQRELSFDPEIEASVRKIVDDVRANGNRAVIEYTNRFDNIVLESIVPVASDELRELHAKVSDVFIEALREAIQNIREFHQLQYRNNIQLEKNDGVQMGLRYTPLENVGIYVPGGVGAYPSTIVMNTVPAQIAGVERIVAVTPPGQFKSNPHVAAAFVELGIEEIYTIGGAQAVAALAYGTESIPRVDKIVGPGNMYVAIAKKLVYGQVDIDMIAGPSEIVVIADDTAKPDFVAADLLSQAEHGSGMELAILITTSRKLAAEVQNELNTQVETLGHSADIKKVLDTNAIILVENPDEAVELTNRIAPEHLELMVRDTDELVKNIRNAGAIFIGEYSPEPISDYFGGTNHVLPTSGAARYASPLGVYDFQKCSNVVRYSKQAVYDCCEKVSILARSEGFEAHARSVEKRCEKND
ncbi:histidinol dehydrogenase [Candidatus Latescibacterota bacterium]